MPTAACSASAIARPDGSEGAPALPTRCCWPATASAATRRWCASCCPRCATRRSPATPATTAARIAWGRALGARAGRPRRLPGPWLLGRAAGRADDLGGDDARRRAGQCARASASTTRPQGYSEAAVQVLAQPGGIAWNVFDDALLALARGFPDFRDAEAAGALRSARRRRRAGRAASAATRRRWRATLAGTHAARRPFHAVQGHRRAVPHPGRAGHRRALPRAARRRHAAAQPAGRRRRGARRLGRRGLGLPVGQRAAQRRGRRLHRRAARRRRCCRRHHER